MKKILAMLLAAMMLLSVVACGNTTETPDTNDDANVNDDTNVNEDAGATDEGTTDEGTTDEGTTDEGTTDEGTTDEGTTDEGTTDEGTTDEGTTEDETVELAYNSAEELLTLIWNAFAEEEKFFVGGGDPEHMVMDAPGKFHLDIEDAAASLEAVTYFPADNIGLVADVATLMHGMMANNFTCGAFRFNNAEDAAAMAEVLKNLYPTVQWRCGFPEKFTVITLPGNYVIAAFGLGEYCIDPLIAHTTETIEGAVVVVNQILE